MVRDIFFIVSYKILVSITNTVHWLRIPVHRRILFRRLWINTFIVWGLLKRQVWSLMIDARNNLEFLGVVTVGQT